MSRLGVALAALLCAAAAAAAACDAEAPPPAPLAPSVAVAPRPPRPYYEATLALPPPPETRVIGDSSDASEARFAGVGARRSGRPIDLDLRDVDIANVCRLLADVGRVNIVLGDDVHGQVTVKMTGVPWDTALDVILRAKGLRAESMADVIIVHAK